MRLNKDDVRYAHGLDAAKANDYLVEEGDLLFTRYSGNPDYVGACASVKGLDRPTLHPDKLIRAKVREEVISPAFLEMALSTGYSRAAIERRSKTTAGQTGISGSDLKSVPVPVPPLEVQEQIIAEVERRLSVADDLEEQIRRSLARADALRRSALIRAFSGRLHLSADNRVSAS